MYTFKFTLLLSTRKWYPPIILFLKVKSIFHKKLLCVTTDCKSSTGLDLRWGLGTLTQFDL